MEYCGAGIYINTISGGIVNFGGAKKIAPISITTSTGASGSSNSGASVRENPNMGLTIQGTIGRGGGTSGGT